MKRRNAIRGEHSNDSELDISQSQGDRIIDYNYVPASNYSINFERANASWESGYTELIDIFSSEIGLAGDEVISSPTHMLGQAEKDIKLIAYNDADKFLQEDIARFIRPDEIAISIKHHSPVPDEDEKEQMKLQCTHIQIAVGVTSKGKDGVITLNNPQDYQNGLFGPKDYPMIFIKPIFPEGVSKEKVRDYVNNIRTWLAIANTFTVFPDDYNGGDPLATCSVEQVKQLGDKLIDALLGNQEAVDWFSQPENQVYCAELAHISLNLGIHYPLNNKFIGQERYDLLKDALVTKDFVSQNENTYIKLVSMCVAPDDLQPITDVINTDARVFSSAPFDKNLAVKPFTVANIIEKYIQFSIPREELGEDVAIIQAGILKKCQPAVFTALGIDKLSPDNEKRTQVTKLYEQIVSCVGKKYENYNKFREAISPILEKTKTMTSPRENGVGAFIPPHCFLVRAAESIKGRTDIGLLKWQYVGHGLHESILDKI